MDRVIIGVDPHKLSVTIEARDNREILRATGQFATDGRSYRRLARLDGSTPAMASPLYAVDYRRRLLARVRGQT